MDGFDHIHPLVWAICGFCRWAHWLASQLFHMWYFPIGPLFSAWLEAFSLQQDVFTWLQSGAPHLVVILSFVMFGLSFLHFLGQIVGPTQFVLQSAYIDVVYPVELFLCLCNPNWRSRPRFSFHPNIK